MDLAEALQSAIDACGEWVDPAPLVRAQDALHAPWRVVVVGRVAAGKSTLVNRLAGSPMQAVGLGGVTQEAAEVSVQDVVLVDTPGIDDPDRALIGLSPLLAEADAVIWVVDGLQPVTASERSVLQGSLVEHTTVEAVVSKVDLIDDEVAAVVARVRALGTVWGVSDVRPVDLRSEEASVHALEGMGRPSGPGVRRRSLVREALERVEEQLEGVHVPPDREALLEAWTVAVRGAVAELDAQIERGDIQHKTDALAALGGCGPTVMRAVQRALGPDAPPRMPTPEPPSVTGMGQMLAGLSGQEGARRTLKAGAARWLAEGQIVLREWWAGDPSRAARSEGYRHLRASLDALGRAL